MMTNRKQKKFAVVSFPEENNSLAVVPLTWLMQGEASSDYICFWPLGFNNMQLKKAVKEEQKPDRKSWNWYPATVIHQSKSYERADEKMRTYQYRSDVEEFSPDTDVENSLRFSSEIIQNQPEEEEESQDLLASRVQQQISPPIQPVMDICCVNCKEMKGDMSVMSTEMVMIKRQMVEMQLGIAYLVQNAQNTQVESAVIGDFHQLESIEDLIAFNAKLEDSDVFSKMINYLGSYGGKDKHAATRKVMSILMTNDLAMKLNWIGGVNKRSIQEFKLVIQLVAASVRHNKSFSDATLMEVDAWIARWLRYAADRRGGKRKILVDNEAHKRRLLEHTSSI